MSIFALLSFSGKAMAADKLVVSTTQYTVLSSDVYMFGGAFSGNVNKKPITTFFQFKKGDANFDKDGQATVPIVRKSADDNGEFYSNPELNLDSTYFFRAGGYYNDNQAVRFYGQTFSFRTAFPYPASFPFVVEYGVEGGVQVVPYVAPEPCPTGNLRNPETGECVLILTCTSPKVFSASVQDCVTPLKCVSPNVFDAVVNRCVPLVPCGENQVRDFSTDRCVDRAPVSTTPNTIGIASPTQGAPSSQLNNSSLTPPVGDSDNGLIPCGNPGQTGCDYKTFIQLLNNVINFIIKGLVIPIAAIMFAYAGIQLIAHGGAPESRTKAKTIFFNTVIGLVLVVGAFLIIKTFLIIVGYKDVSLWF